MAERTDAFFKGLGHTYEGKTPKCYVIGCGNRGRGYAEMAKESPDALSVVGCSELMTGRRELVRTTYADTLIDAGCEEDPWRYVTKDWRDLLELPKRADFVIITTLDHQHAEPAIAFMEKGYHCLVEKPMATTPEDCVRMVQTAKRCNVMLGVCHVLRYTPYTRVIRDLIASGAIGDVRAVQHIEPVGNWHFAHSYVRGNWSNTRSSAFVLMAKSCHDIDWLRYVIGLPIREISCMGSQTIFTKENKPAEAGDATRCTDCAFKNKCIYNAEQIYNARAERGVKGFPVAALVDGEPDIENVAQAVQAGPYGRCVYECDNNQPDVITANLRFASDDGKQTAYCAFIMDGPSEEICQRFTRISGTKGELSGDMSNIKRVGFGALSHETEHLRPQGLSASDTRLTGHWGADWYCMNSFCAAIALNDPSLILAGPDETLETHMATFAAEEARVTGKNVNVQEFISRYS